MVAKTTMQVSERNLELLARGKTREDASYDAVLTRLLEGDLEPEDLRESEDTAERTAI